MRPPKRTVLHRNDLDYNPMARGEYAMKTRTTRRSFLQATGAMGAALWIPRHVKGYTAAEMRGLAKEARMEAGVSKWDLDTPALCVDLDKLEQNLARMRAALTRSGIASRPHAKTHKTPAIARLQLASGSIGICVAKLSEAEVMFDHGIEKILMTTINASPDKIRRAMKLRKWCDGFIQAVDNPVNARDLSEAAKEAGVVADVVVDADPGSHRTGVAPGEPALALARLVDNLPGLRLKGVLCYDGGGQHINGFAKRRARSIEMMGPASEMVALMKRSGLNTEIFSGGGTGTYNVLHETPGFTDVQCGSYIFMDSQYLAIGSEDGNPVYMDFAPSLTVLTTILNAYTPGRLTTDAGAKALTLNQPDGMVLGEPGMSYNAGSDEFGTLRFEKANRNYKVGDKLEVIIPHCDPVVNEFDQMYGTRKDLVEVVWPISARGKSQ